MRALAGLGNPGAEYARTRHNAGWILLDRLIGAGRVLEEREREWVHLTKLKLGPAVLWLLRPHTTYMNRSGLGVEQGLRSLQIEPGELVVAHDDVDLPLGALRLRRDGGSGGHRGVESVIESLGTSRFARLRLGVRGEQPWRDTAEYVLSEFAPEENEILEQMLDRAVAAVRMILRRGLGAAMNTYNRRPEPRAPASSTEPEQTE